MLTCSSLHNFGILNLDTLALEPLVKEKTVDLICYYMTIPCVAWKNDQVCV